MTQMHPADKPKMATEAPPAITIADSVQARLGTLRFFDGFPDDATVERVSDDLDFQRGVQTFPHTKRELGGGTPDLLQMRGAS